LSRLPKVTDAAESLPEARSSELNDLRDPPDTRTYDHRRPFVRRD
jgi:hypothetical protein